MKSSTFDHGQHMKTSAGYGSFSVSYLKQNNVLRGIYLRDDSLPVVSICLR